MVRYFIPDTKDAKYCPLHNIHHYCEICPMCSIVNRDGFDTVFTEKGAPYLVPAKPTQKPLMPLEWLDSASSVSLENDDQRRIPDPKEELKVIRPLGPIKGGY